MNQFLELPEASFSKSFRGYSVSDVEHYVQQIHDLANQTNQIVEQLNTKIYSLEKEIIRLQEAEIALIRALNLSEEAKENYRLKVEEEKVQVIQHAENKAADLLQKAKQEVDKLYMVFEQEKNLQKDQLQNEILEQERTYNQLKEAQKLIASQLLEISNVTIHKIGEWEKEIKEEVSSNKEEVRSNKEEGRSNKEEGRSNKVGFEKKRGRPSLKNKEIKTVAKTAKQKIEKQPSQVKPVSEKKSPGRPKKVIPVPEIEDGLPTLGKVLEAYAKSNQPKGKIADIN